MKYQKMFVSAAALYLFFAVSSNAMARNDCPTGSIVGGSFDEIIINEFVDCSILGVDVSGNVIVRNAGQFTIKSSLVNGNLRVLDGQTADISDVNVKDGNLVTRGIISSTVLSNVVTNGNMIVDGDDDECGQTGEAIIMQNLVFNGNMRVRCNKQADVKDNKVTNGNIRCKKNSRLDSIKNDVFGGVEDCSKI